MPFKYLHTNVRDYVLRAVGKLCHCFASSDEPAEAFADCPHDTHHTYSMPFLGKDSAWFT